MKKRKLIISVAAISIMVLLTACNGKADQQSQAATDTISADSIAAHQLPLPQIPDSITGNTARADYLTLHFWDAMDYNNPGMTGDTLLLEQTMSNFVYLLPQATEKGRRDAVARMQSGATGNVMAYIHLHKLAEKYLYDIDSPFFNEDLFKLFLEGYINGNVVTPAEKETPRVQLADIAMARPGSAAPDLNLVTGGTTTRLSHLTEGTQMSIVMFFDDDCGSCITAIKDLAANPTLNDLIAAGKMKVIAVDIADNPVEVAEIPANWTSATARGADDSYVIRNTPSIYAIDSDGKIVLKDAKPEVLTRLLSHN